MTGPADDPRPFLVITAIVDGAARAAAITRSHADAMERVYTCASGQAVAGIDLIELPALAPITFAALRKQFQMEHGTVAMYDLFPLASHLDAATRKVAGQFLASEVLWTLSERGLLGSVPFRPPPLDIPKDWDRDAQKVHERLMSAGALELTPEGIETFKNVRQRWEAANAAATKTG